MPSNINAVGHHTLCPRSRRNSTKSPTQRIAKLFKESIKRTRQYKASTNESTDGVNFRLVEDRATHDEFWSPMFLKMRKIFRSSDALSLHHALNAPYTLKPFNLSSKYDSCASLLQILAWQFLHCAKHNEWSAVICIRNCIDAAIEHGADPSLYYINLSMPPQRCYKALRDIYAGISLMVVAAKSSQREKIYTKHVDIFVRYVSAGNDDTRTLRLDHLHSQYDIPRSSMSSAILNVVDVEFRPSVLTLCLFSCEAEESVDDDELQFVYRNVTHWMGDCVHHADADADGFHYVQLISPHSAKALVMSGYNLLHVQLNEQCIEKDVIGEALIHDDGHKLHGKVAAFLWFIRFGDFKTDLVSIVGVGIAQLARGEFAVGEDIIEEILSYSHHFVMRNTVPTVDDDGCDIDDEGELSKLQLSYFDEDYWMQTAFKQLFELDAVWIEWIGRYCFPQLSRRQIEFLKVTLSDPDVDISAQIQSLSLSAITSFYKHGIFDGALVLLDSSHVQNLVRKHCCDEELIAFLRCASFDTVGTFGNSSVLFDIISKKSVEASQLEAILDALHDRVDMNNTVAKVMIRNLLFGAGEWTRGANIWKRISLVFNDAPKRTYFRRALNSVIEELATETHCAKFLFLMNRGLIDFGYCVTHGLFEMSLLRLMTASPFKQKLECAQAIGHWIFHFVRCSKTEMSERTAIAHRTVVILRTLLAAEYVDSDSDTARYMNQILDVVAQFVIYRATGAESIFYFGSSPEQIRAAIDSTNLDHGIMRSDAEKEEILRRSH